MKKRRKFGAVKADVKKTHFSKKKEEKNWLQTYGFPSFPNTTPFGKFLITSPSPSDTDACGCGAAFPFLTPRPISPSLSPPESPLDELDGEECEDEFGARDLGKEVKKRSMLLVVLVSFGRWLFCRWREGRRGNGRFWLKEGGARNDERTTKFERVAVAVGRFEGSVRGLMSRNKVDKSKKVEVSRLNGVCLSGTGGRAEGGISRHTNKLPPSMIPSYIFYLRNSSASPTLHSLN